MKNKYIILIFLLIFQSSFSEIFLSVNNEKPSISESFRMNIEFINSDKDDYKIDGIENFHIISKGSQSSYNMINGDLTIKKSDTYILKAKSIGKITLQVVSKKEKSNVISMDILENENSNNSILNPKFNLEDIIESRNFYFGEKIAFEEKFTSTVGIERFEYIKRPNFNEISVKEITKMDARGSYPQKRVMINGREAVEIVLFEGILEANSSGEKNIEGGQVMVVESDSQYPSFFSTTTPVYLGDKNIKINVLPLPKGQPANFKNIVGKIKSESSWSSDSISYGEAVTLNLKLLGEGNLEQLDKIVALADSKFTIYDSVKEYKESIVDGKFYNEKTYEVAFIPRLTGKVKIPDIKINYFNTESKTYEELVIKGKEVNISGTPNVQKVIEPQEAESNNKLEKVELKLLEVEKQSNPNPYKLLSFILGIVCLLEFLVIIVRKFWKTKK